MTLMKTKYIRHTISLLFLLYICVLSSSQDVIPLFVALRVQPAALHSIPLDTINNTIKIKFNRYYNAYSPDPYHMTLHEQVPLIEHVG